MERALSKPDLKELVQQTRAYLCIDCSKCTASCPLGRVGTVYSPRSFVQHLLIEDEAPSPEIFWRCLTCGLCHERCPSDVDFPGFVRELRCEAIKQGLKPHTTHSGAIHEIMRIIANPTVKPKRTSWLPDRIQILTEADQAEDIYFVGCAPYFETIFEDFHLSLLETHIAALELLRSCGLNPCVLADERCCGHDALWSGDLELFKRLANLNVEAFRRAGVKRIFVTCPECYHTLAKEYPKYVDDFQFEIIHTVKYLAENLETQATRTDGVTVTYLDSCRMGRFAHLYDEPRKLLADLVDVRLVEMEMNRENAPCCGSNLWINCDSISKRLQVACLEEVARTGASVLICPCDKCRIHLTCAQLDNGDLKLKIKTENILSFLHRRGVS